MRIDTDTRIIYNPTEEKEIPTHERDIQMRTNGKRGVPDNGTPRISYDSNNERNHECQKDKDTFSYRALFGPMKTKGLNIGK